MTDEEALAAHGVDREALMVRVVQVYAQQLFVDGFFNADPHAGNLMVQVRGGVAEPVLLDFGMTVRLSSGQRLGYARLALSAQQMDLCGIIAAVGSLGVKTNQTAAPTRRATSSFGASSSAARRTRDEARKQSSDFFKTRAAQREQDKREGRDERRLDEIPPDLIFFWRVRARTRRLLNSTPRPRAVHGAARRAREARARVAHTAAAARSSPAPPAVRLPHAKCRSTRSVVALAGSCAEGGVGAGVQVCVQRGDTTLAEAAAGFRGQVDAPQRRRRRSSSAGGPSSPSSRCARFAKRGSLADQTIASRRPAFGQNGRRGDRAVHRHPSRRPPPRVRRGLSARRRAVAADLRARLAELAAAPLADGAARGGGVAARRGSSTGAVLAGVAPWRNGRARLPPPSALGVDAAGRHRPRPNASSRASPPPPRRCRRRAGARRRAPSGGEGTPRPSGLRAEDPPRRTGGVAGAQRPQWPQWRRRDGRHAGDARRDQGVRPRHGVRARELPMNSVAMANAPEVRGAAVLRQLRRGLEAKRMSGARGAAAHGGARRRAALDSADGGVEERRRSPIGAAARGLGWLGRTRRPR